MVASNRSAGARSNITRRTLLGSIAAALAGVPAFAQSDWPTRYIRMVSPYGAGGANDISLRILAETLGNRLGQQFIVENRPGAGTRLANEFVAHAPPDGYTFLYAAAPYATAEALFGKLTYERSDLQPVAMAVLAPIFLIVNAGTGFKNPAELIAYGKSRPDGLTFASPGVGSQPHLAAELLFRAAGVKGLNIPFRGDAQAYTELLAGRVDATFTAISTRCPISRPASCACSASPPANAARSTRKPRPCANRAFPGWSLPAGTASWRRPPCRPRSQTGCRRKSAARWPIPG